MKGNTLAVRSFSTWRNSPKHPFKEAFVRTEQFKISLVEELFEVISLCQQILQGFYPSKACRLVSHCHQACREEKEKSRASILVSFCCQAERIIVVCLKRILFPFHFRLAFRA